MKKERMTIARGVLAIAGSLYLGLCVFSYSKWDPSLFTYSPEPAKNMGGALGAYIADLLMTLIGTASYSVPFFLAVYGMKGVLLRERQKINLIGSLLFMLSASMLSFLIASSFGLSIEAGMVGRGLGGVLASLISVPGTYILGIALFLSSLILLSPASVIYYFLGLGGKKSLEGVKPGPGEKPEEKYVATEEGLVGPGRGLAAPYLTDEQVPEVFSEAVPVLPEEGLPAPEEDLPEDFEPEETGFDEIRELEEALVAASAASSRQEDVVPDSGGPSSGYELPSIELLMLHDASNHPGDSGGAKLREAAADTSALEKRLSDFGVQGRVTQVHVGPIVTMYEFEPAPGVKINRIVSLADDIALGLKAKSVRISPISGKSTLGLEVPNRLRETVSLREIIASDGFRKSGSRLTMALGKDIFGNPIIADLTKMPHLLVAGSTGSGKSVALNSMVVSVLYKAAPDEVKMLLIDPKLLELSVYEGIPHLISPVITSPKEAAEALKKIVFEMDRRYRLLAERGARNIDGYNASASPEERMPYIVVVIDELADLMFTSASEVEDSIARLAQMARASGIHLILATQRPSVDVITGVIKANFPARISFQVTSKIDSRTILDAQGAEQLIGKGDMLFMLPGSRTIRVHGALVTESEINSITSFVKAQGAPDYGMLASMPAEEQKESSVEDERDDLYFKAVEFADAAGEVSISSIQRRLKIGYNRAARIMELMEEDGLVGPPRGAGKPRDFLRRR